MTFGVMNGLKGIKKGLNRESTIYPPREAVLSAVDSIPYYGKVKPAFNSEEN
jgi:hypothetical protein